MAQQRKKASFSDTSLHFRPTIICIAIHDLYTISNAHAPCRYTMWITRTHSTGYYLFSCKVQIQTLFQSGSENISPMPCPSAVMREAAIRYFFIRMDLTDSARAQAILSFTSILPSGEEYPLITTLDSGCLFI